MPQEDERLRQSGRTTGLMLRALGEAVGNPGKKVEFIDHYPTTYGYADRLMRNLRELAWKTELGLEIRLDGNRIFITSHYNANNFVYNRNMNSLPQKDLLNLITTADKKSKQKEKKKISITNSIMCLEI